MSFVSLENSKRKGSEKVEQKILARIQFLKKEMVKVAEVKGLNDAEVLELSREIDRLHNRLNRIQYGYTYPATMKSSKRSTRRQTLVRELPHTYDEFEYAIV